MCLELCQTQQALENKKLIISRKYLFWIHLNEINNKENPIQAKLTEALFMIPFMYLIKYIEIALIYLCRLEIFHHDLTKR